MAVQTDKDLLTFTSEEAVINMLIGKHFVCHVWNKLFKAELLKDIRFFEELRNFEDVPFSIATILKAKKVCFTEQRLYNYLTRQGSILRCGFNENLLNVLVACDKAEDSLKQHGLDGKLKKYFDTFVILSVIIIMRRFGNDKGAIRKYAPMLRKKIRAHYNKESLPYMSSNTKRNMLLIMISWRLYFFTLNIVRTH